MIKQKLMYISPSNIRKVEYKDKAENCFEYIMEEVQCPSNKKILIMCQYNNFLFIYRFYKILLYFIYNIVKKYVRKRIK